VDGGKALHPARVVVEHGGYASLLQHDLGHPDGVGISQSPTIANNRQLWATHVFAAPWEIATMCVVPVQ
jgi:hypothetical protein